MIAASEDAEVPDCFRQIIWRLIGARKGKFFPQNRQSTSCHASKPHKFVRRFSHITLHQPKSVTNISSIKNLKHLRSHSNALHRNDCVFLPTSTYTQHWHVWEDSVFSAPEKREGTLFGPSSVFRSDDRRRIRSLQGARKIVNRY